MLAPAGELSPRRICWRGSDLNAVRLARVRLDVADQDGPVSLTVSANDLTIASNFESAEAPFTLQWQYRLSLEL